MRIRMKRWLGDTGQTSDARLDEFPPEKVAAVIDALDKAGLLPDMPGALSVSSKLGAYEDVREILEGARPEFVDSNIEVHLTADELAPGTKARAVRHAKQRAEWIAEADRAAAKTPKTKDRAAIEAAIADGTMKAPALPDDDVSSDEKYRARLHQRPGVGFHPQPAARSLPELPTHVVADGKLRPLRAGDVVLGLKIKGFGGVLPKWVQAGVERRRQRKAIIAGRHESIGPAETITQLSVYDDRPDTKMGKAGKTPVVSVEDKRPLRLRLDQSMAPARKKRGA